jgi:hypothetical protein
VIRYCPEKNGHLKRVALNVFCGDNSRYWTMSPNPGAVLRIGWPSVAGITHTNQTNDKFTIQQDVKK